MIECAPHAYSTRPPVRGLAFRIARNTVIDFARTRRTAEPLGDEAGTSGRSPRAKLHPRTTSRPPCGRAALAELKRSSATWSSFVLRRAVARRDRGGPGQARRKHPRHPASRARSPPPPDGRSGPTRRHAGRSMSWQRLGRSVSPGSGIDADGTRGGLPGRRQRGRCPRIPSDLARVRRSLVAEFRVAAARQAAAADPVKTSRGRVWFRSPRPALALALGLALVIGSVGVVAAGSTPGRPLYGLRLGLESLMLPASGRPERLDAQIARLERRLVEAEKATTFGDSIAASDAIAAYRSELGDTGAELADANGQRLGQVLAGHAILLARLGTDLSGPAKSSTDEALDQVNRLRQTIDGQPGDKPSDKPGKSGGNGGDGGGNGTGGGNGGERWRGTAAATAAGMMAATVAGMAATTARMGRRSTSSRLPVGRSTRPSSPPSSSNSAESDGKARRVTPGGPGGLPGTQCTDRARVTFPVREARPSGRPPCRSGQAPPGAPRCQIP